MVNLLVISSAILHGNSMWSETAEDCPKISCLACMYHIVHVRFATCRNTWNRKSSLVKLFKGYKFNYLKTLFLIVIEFLFLYYQVGEL